MRTELALFVAALAIAAGGWLSPDWLSFLLTLAIAKALVVLGVVVQMRVGLVSFGQALFYCVGGYAVGLGAQYLGWHDAFAQLALGVAVALAVAAACGLLL